jgi:hypothetical protein
MDPVVFIPMRPGLDVANQVVGMDAVRPTCRFAGSGELLPSRVGRQAYGARADATDAYRRPGLDGGIMKIPRGQV